MVVIWGDSHAQHFAPSIALNLLPRGYVVVVEWSRSCPPLTDTAVSISAAGGKISAECMAFNAAMPATLGRIPNLALLVLAARWTPYIPSPLVPVASDRTLLDDKGRPADAASTTLLLQRGLSRSVAEVTMRSVPAFIIDQGPDFARSPRTCIGRTLMLRGDTARCRTNEDVSADRRAILTAAIDAVTSEDPLVTAYHPARTLCHAGICRSWNGDQPLFHDANHLSVAGARYFVPLLRSPLLHALDVGRDTREQP